MSCALSLYGSRRTANRVLSLSRLHPSEIMTARSREVPRFCGTLPNGSSWKMPYGIRKQVTAPLSRMLPSGLCARPRTAQLCKPIPRSYKCSATLPNRRFSVCTWPRTSITTARNVKWQPHGAGDKTPCKASKSIGSAGTEGPSPSGVMRTWLEIARATWNSWRVLSRIFQSGEAWRCNCGRDRKWRPSAVWRVGSPTILTTCWV